MSAIVTNNDSWYEKESIILDMVFGSKKSGSLRTVKHGRKKIKEYNVGGDIKDRTPTSAIYVPMDYDRIYTTDRNLISDRVSDFTESFEVLIDKGDMSWSRIDRIERPREYYSAGDEWFEVHFMTFHKMYQKSYTCLKNSVQMPIYRRGWEKVDWTAKGYPDQVQMLYSMLDDFYAPHGVRVYLNCMGVEIKITCSHDQAYDLLSIRDGPIAQRKKRPVAHWVVSHSRNKGEVKRHIRGTEEFEIDGIHVRVIPVLGINE